MRARYVGVILCVVVAVFSTTQAFAAKNILFIFDASGSMSAQIPEGTKIDIARRVLSERVQKLPDSGIDAGLVVYGHRQKGDCGDIEQRMKLKPLNKKMLIDSVQSIHPKGKTPIAASIRLAVDQLKELEDETTIILISDGQETCDPDPCAVVQQLKDTTGIKFILHVIGFDVNKEERRQLECLAEKGGGEYVPAPTAGKLDEALRALTMPIVTAMVKVQENIEIILDTSVAMQKPFEGGTKLEAAVKALNKVLSLQVADRDNLAFRRFGGPCKGDNTQLLVNFGQNNAKQIRAALPSVTKGDTTTVNAVTRAASDFDDLQRFADVNRRVLIITGGQDLCYPQAANVIRQILLSKKIRPIFWLIAMDVPPDQQRQLIEIGRATEGKLFPVKNQNELENILERLFEVEPVIADINTMVDILNSIVKHYNTSNRFLEQKRYTEAENEINEAHAKFKKTELPFQDLEKRLTREDFRRAYELVKTNRELQSQLLTIVESSVPLTRSDDTNAYNESIRRANKTVEPYNENVRRIEEILRQYN